MSAEHGKVFFIGLGPEEPGYLGSRALSLLHSASVVVFGPEVEKGWGHLIPKAAEPIFTGRRQELMPPTPEQIIDSMRRACTQGKSVVRLFPGDPLFHAAGESEIALCRNYGIRFEILPGVPSAIAASAFAGIPLLNSTLASSLLVLHTPGLIARENVGNNPPNSLPPGPKDVPSSSERKPGVRVRRLGAPAPKESRASSSVVPLPPPAPPPVNEGLVNDGAINWKTVARSADVLLFLEAGLFMDRLVPGLTSAGRSSGEPVALIMEPGSARQRTVVSSVGTLRDELARHHIPSNAILIVGDTVNLRELMDFRGQRRLQGLKVALLEGIDAMGAEAELLEASGAQVQFFTLAKTIPQTALGELLEGMGDDLRNAHYMVFVDDVAAEIFLGGLHEANLDVRVLPEYCQVIALGMETAARLRSSGIQSLMIDSAVQGEGALLMQLPKSLLERRVLFVESVASKRDLQRDLRVRGAVVTPIPVYERLYTDSEVDRLEKALSSGSVDMVVVHSEEVARLMIETWGVAKTRKLLDGVLTASSCLDASAFLEGAGLKPTTTANGLSRLVGILESQGIATVEGSGSGVRTPSPPPVPRPVAVKPDESNWD